MERLPGFTSDALDDAQDRYGLRFPPDLVELLRERRLDARYDWAAECPAIRRMLEWPFDMLQFDIENGLWWPDWGERPTTAERRGEVLRAALAAAPKLIPLYVHRFLPETPASPGNPVFSMHGFDTIVYGANLSAYVEKEFDWTWGEPAAVPAPVPFWSGFIAPFDEAYAYYAAAAAESDRHGG
ncbi:MAG TPA: hypothetical protein VGC56_17610 [Allosphingosinicella sp.]|jgi:hypothetical protein